MRARLVWPSRLLAMLFSVLGVYSLTRGQERPAASKAGVPAAPTKKDFSKLVPLHQQFWLSAKRGAEWLHRANEPDGHFTNGVVPSLGVIMTGDEYLRQASAAATLAHAARFMGDARYAARATQAIVLLLTDTVQDPLDPQIRYTAFPNTSVNRLAAAGLLVWAIHELPEADKDLLAKSEQLCNFLHKQQQADGSLSLSGSARSTSNRERDSIGVDTFPGQALYGLIRSQQRQPAAWKMDFVRNSLAYYKTWWRQHQTMTFIPWQTAAYTEAYQLTKEQPFADFVFEMNDWLAGLQYQGGAEDAKQLYWSGGFKTWAEGQPIETPPQASSACYAEGLVEACRVARATGDLNRHKTYTAALDRCLTFLSTLQYTESNTKHFAEWYRPSIVGGFHASHTDGDLRIDYTQHAVNAMIQHLSYVAQVQ